MNFTSLSAHWETMQYSAIDSSTTSNGNHVQPKLFGTVGHISQLYWKQLIQSCTVVLENHPLPSTAVLQQYKVRGGFQVPHLYANRLQVITCYIKIDM